MIKYFVFIKDNQSVPFIFSAVVIWTCRINDGYDKGSLLSLSLLYMFHVDMYWGYFCNSCLCAQSLDPAAWGFFSSRRAANAS